MAFSYNRDIIGRCLAKPMRRVSNDFYVAEGLALIRAAIEQILLTRRGELRWQPSFGSGLDRFRHRNASDILLDEITESIKDTLAMWEPRVTVTHCGLRVEGTTIFIKITWMFNPENNMQTNQRIESITQEIKL